MPLKRSRETVEALADTIFPSAPDCPAGSLIVPDAFYDLAASLEPAAVKELAIVLGLFEMGALPLHGRRFSRLSESKRERYLRSWMKSRLAFRRQIYRALRNLISNLYFDDPRTWAALGYEGPTIAKERTS